MLQSSTMKIAALAAIVILICVAIFGLLRYWKGEEQVPSPITVVETKEATPVASQRIIGASVEGRNIEVYSYGSGKKHLVFMGGIHGGYEWNSVLLAYKFIDYLNTNPGFVPKDIIVHIVPSVNPDGIYKVAKKEGRFTEADVPKDEVLLASGRFNANNVDINRNFDCKWQPKSSWRAKEVSAGAAPFSEPESKAVRSLIQEVDPIAVVFWHSQANAVYASQCEKGILPETLTLMNLYAKASGYAAVQSFDAYEVTGAADDWLASIGVPAVTVELKTHETVEWEQNFKAVQAMIEHYSQP